MTVRQAASLWGVSDRLRSVSVQSGKIPGAIQEGVCGGFPQCQKASGWPL